MSVSAVIYITGVFSIRMIPDKLGQKVICLCSYLSFFMDDVQRLLLKALETPALKQDVENKVG